MFNVLSLAQTQFEGQAEATQLFVVNGFALKLIFAFEVYNVLEKC